jgi:hypothetical protein
LKASLSYKASSKPFWAHSETLSQKQKHQKQKPKNKTQAGVLAPVVKCLPTKYEALSSNPIHVKQNKTNTKPTNQTQIKKPRSGTAGSKTMLAKTFNA